VGSSDPHRVIDLDDLYPLAWGTDFCSRCGAETETTDAWGNPWCEECWNRGHEALEQDER